jgi:hypothetical protein
MQYSSRNVIYTSQIISTHPEKTIIFKLYTVYTCIFMTTLFLGLLREE